MFMSGALVGPLGVMNGALVGPLGVMNGTLVGPIGVNEWSACRASWCL